MSPKSRSVGILIIVEIFVLSLWFVSAAILPEMAREAAMSPARQAALSSAVQAGFVVGALVSAAFGVSDRFDPRRVMAASAIGAAAANAALLVVPIGGIEAVMLRGVTGVLMAGVYPVGMKVVVGWGLKDRGLLVGILVGALTFGNASPHLVALLGGADWRVTVGVTSCLAALGGLAALGAELGPHHARAARFEIGAIRLAWTDRRIRLAYGGYLGHMWELFAMWAWIGAATTASYALSVDAEAARRLGALTAFLAIAVGGLACVPAGWFADRIGKAETTIVAMAASGLAALAVALSFGGPVWVTFVLVMVWGAAVIPDSAQFSALVADAAPPHLAGSLMTFQTALGFALTIVTVQVTPQIAAATGWPVVLATMAIGPAFGIAAMLGLLGAAGR